ncbi:hypothetical protein V3C10_23660 [[Clostridium] symbiosum]|uniref:hypothetical protein n=1 Tax=Clostridium symbiosum TaxID=1512 RepID=UPI001D0691B0|nr:hypothetical protein [[Clostridium] symbiosum]MCB6609757.1 hypothetical protein [[Clostridium] symbiosum]
MSKEKMMIMVNKRNDAPDRGQVHSSVLSVVMTAFLRLSSFWESSLFEFRCLRRWEHRFFISAIFLSCWQFCAWGENVQQLPVSWVW